MQTCLQWVRWLAHFGSRWTWLLWHDNINDDKYFLYLSVCLEEETRRMWPLLQKTIQTLWWHQVQWSSVQPIQKWMKWVWNPASREHQHWKKTLRLSGSSGKSGKWKQGETVLQSCAGGRLTGYEGYVGQIGWWGSWQHPKICSWSDQHNHVGLRISNWEAESDMRAPSLLQASWFLARGTKVHAFSADIFVRFVFFFAWDALGKPHLLILCVLVWRFFNGTCREAKMNLKRYRAAMVLWRETAGVGAFKR